MVKNIWAARREQRKATTNKFKNCQQNMRLEISMRKSKTKRREVQIERNSILTRIHQLLKDENLTEMNIKHNKLSNHVTTPQECTRQSDQSE